MKNLVSHHLGEAFAVLGVNTPLIRVVAPAAPIRPQDCTVWRLHDLDVTFSNGRGFSCRSGRKRSHDGIVVSNKPLGDTKHFGARAFRIVAQVIRAGQKIGALAHGVAGALVAEARSDKNVVMRMADTILLSHFGDPFRARDHRFDCLQSQLARLSCRRGLAS